MAGAGPNTSDSGMARSRLLIIDLYATVGDRALGQGGASLALKRGFGTIRCCVRRPRHRRTAGVHAATPATPVELRATSHCDRGRAGPGACTHAFPDWITFTGWLVFGRVHAARRLRRPPRRRSRRRRGLRATTVMATSGQRVRHRHARARKRISSHRRRGRTEHRTSTDPGSWRAADDSRPAGAKLVVARIFGGSVGDGRFGVDLGSCRVGVRAPPRELSSPGSTVPGWRCWAAESGRVGLAQPGAPECAAWLKACKIKTSRHPGLKSG